MNLYKGGLEFAYESGQVLPMDWEQRKPSTEKYEDKNKKNISKADSRPRLAQSEAFPKETIYFLIWALLDFSAWSQNTEFITSTMNYFV